MGHRIIFALFVLIGIAACLEKPGQLQPLSTVPPADTHAASPNESADAAAAKAEAEAESSDQYPLDVCVVSGEKLGSMGPPVEVEVEGRTVKLCRAGCKPQLLAEPAKYLAMLDAPAAMPGKPGSRHDGHEHDGHDH